MWDRSNGVGVAIPWTVCCLVIFATFQRAAGEVRVQRAVVGLTHKAVARGYPKHHKGYPVVGDPRSPAATRWADLYFRYHFTVFNDGTKTAKIAAVAQRPDDFKIAAEFRMAPEQADVAAGTSCDFTLIVKVPGEAAAKLPGGYWRKLSTRFTGAGVGPVSREVVFWVPAVAKILAGADGTSLPADVLPPGADFADEFSGGWNGKSFAAPFVMSTAAAIKAMRRMVAEGVKPGRYPYVRADLSKKPDTVTPEMIPKENHHTKHNRFAHAILDFTLRWVHTGQKHFAQRARDLILAYVDRAHKLGLGLKGRVGLNGLSDAWFTSFAFPSYDLLKGTGLFTPAQQKRVEAWMLYEANMMADQMFGFNNMQCEENFPVMVAGLVGGRFDYLRFTYYPPYGLDGQLSGAFFADGFHRECQFGYHYRSINPIADQAEALLRLGFCVYDDRMRRALMNPVRRAMGLGELLGGQDTQACQVAFLRYRDPLAAAWLRRKRLPLHYGGLLLPKVSDAYWRKPVSHMPASGQTVLRGQVAPKDVRTLKLHWGMSNKRQGRDFMDYMLLYSGRAFSAGDYGVNDTLGHNAIIVNYDSMRRSGGVPVELGLDEAVPYVVAVNPSPTPRGDTAGSQPWPYPWPWRDAGKEYGTYQPLSITGHRERDWGPMYDGATWTRTAAVIEGGFLIADRVALVKPGCVDRPLHLSAGYRSLKELEPSIKLARSAKPIGSTSQYKAAIPPPLAAGSATQMTGPAFPQATTDKSWSVTVFNRHGEHSFSVKTSVLGVSRTRVIRVESLKLGFGYHSPFLIIRRDGVARTRFVTFIEPYGYSRVMNRRDTTAKPKLRGMTSLPVTDAKGRALPEADAAALRLDFGSRRVYVVLNDTGQEVRGPGIRTAKRFAYRVEENDRP